MRKQAALLHVHVNPKPRASAVSGDNGVSVAVGGDNNAPINVSFNSPRRIEKSKYPPNSIGADANLSGYVEYLVELAGEYWKNIPNMGHGRIGRKIKLKFRLGKRTRSHLGVERFQDLVDFIIKEILQPSPAGKRHRRNGTRVCRSFDEWRFDKM